MSGSLGRPTSSQQVREELINHARILFVAQPYEKVSLRMVANAVNVNMAMIRYYFNNKAGLFEAMLRETLTPVHQKLANANTHLDNNILLEIMNNFYQFMVKHKNFPRFIAKTMQLPPDKIQRQIVEKVLLENLPSVKQKTITELNKEDVLQANVNAQLAHFTMLSLTLFPFVAPPEILKIHSITIDENFLSSLLTHNTNLLNQGIIHSHEH